MEIVVMPLVGSGVFSDHSTHAGVRVLASLILHTIYGGVFGAVAGEQAEHAFHVTHPA
jgi:hypothetical protein